MNRYSDETFEDCEKSKIKKTGALKKIPIAHLNIKGMR